MSCVLEVVNLSLSYDVSKERTNREQQWIFKELNFKVSQGDFIMLTGHSGCGKSSLLNMINGVIPNLKKAEVEGDIYIHGQRVTDRSVRERTKSVGSVFQNPREQIIFDQVADEIVFPMENINETPMRMREKLTSLLDMTGLSADAKTATLSGGEKQKLMTACTLGMDQKILLLDEPLANMDARSAKELLELLKRLSDEENYTVILSEHRQELVLPYVDKVFSCVKSVDKNVEMTLEFRDNAEDYECGLSSLPDRPSRETAQATAGAKPVFSVENIDYRVGDRFLFNNFSWQINKGEEWVILGENGCGKTTLLNLLFGLVRPTAGAIVSPYSKKRNKRKIGYVLQNPDYQLFMPHVKDELYLNAKSPEFVERLIRLFGFEHMLERHPLSLSEGQKRKLGFACIIANEPEVLFLDEPTAGLDDEGMEQLLHALQILNEKTDNDRTIVTISHDKRAIPYLGDQFLVLSNCEPYLQFCNHPNAVNIQSR
ncbi:MAG TPA: ATP-binding cassette domain-containing protein [Clostridiaceae bacterium]|jgi:energy-coupling factor transporter ATP-binding protein EcfA2|nr:ATP-binding cassette domain-containing protein [Clostridiaceae bacterium]